MKLVAEVVPGKLIEHEIAMIERPDEISPDNVGQKSTPATGTQLRGRGGHHPTTLHALLVHGMADLENHSDRILGESKECLTAWKQLYKAAVLETNMDLVPRRVQEARKAAGERAMHLIREPADDDLELQDLVYASRVLDKLNRKCQSARDSKPK